MTEDLDVKKRRILFSGTMVSENLSIEKLLKTPVYRSGMNENGIRLKEEKVAISLPLFEDNLQTLLDKFGESLYFCFAVLSKSNADGWYHDAIFTMKIGSSSTWSCCWKCIQTKIERKYLKKELFYIFYA
ncbi:uncharacterized protein OCT59_022324 [Rhizophagus irregularis]|uniref:Uncharacterized protein n=1 Tax=Rhizophagus irregularis TaxID=588596 RepID=A0A915ZFH0_9GLOM|nr:hypothetical protein OCT59_022324 [Rhizophagus irregularis]CAB4486209.1 unnamed protein product [Rhizophagus irregularis]CAB5193589.1 unnamed protein product [Rhizophagus irregularis]CAB5373097.1 unnamed protein product [Rhizophagus irregularis]